MSEKIIDFTDPDLYVDRVTEFTDALYDPDIRYIFLKGGAGAGKSYLVAQIMIQNILDGIRLGVFRKVSSTLKASCLQLFKDITSERGLLGGEIEVKENKEVRSLVSNGLAMMFGLDDPEKIKSLANFDRFWIEETTELTYDDFTQLDLRLRGGKNHKVISSFNPISSRHWLKVSIFDAQRPDAQRIMKTARDNRFVGQKYLDNLNSLKDKNLAKYLVYARNQWGEAVEGLVYQHYTVFNYDIIPEVIGLDFGWNDPCALIYMRREDTQGKKKKLLCQEKIYERELTSTMLINRMKDIGVPKHVLIIADSSRPEMINDISLAGYNIVGVKKYAGSVKDQIANVQSYDIHIFGENIHREIATYMRKKDRDGKPLDVPCDGDDHTLDSVRYGGTYFYPQDDILVLA